MMVLLPSSVVAESVINNKEATIKLYHHNGLSLSDNCGNALVTSFLVAFNTINAQQQQDFSAMNFKASELYFEFENDHLGGASTAWIEGSFDAVCETCDYNDNIPPVLFHNGGDFLSDATIHHQIESEMLRLLKHGQICPDFAELQDVEILYKPSSGRSNLASLMAASPEEDEEDEEDGPVFSQESVMATMDGIDRTLISQHTCEGVLEDAWMSTLTDVFGDEYGELVQAFTVDSSSLLGGQTINTTTITTTAPGPLFSLRATKPVKTKSTVLARGRYNAHMDIEFPSTKKMASIMGEDRLFNNKKDSIALVARHSAFEALLEETLRANTNCGAFQHISNLSVRFQGKYSDTEEEEEEAAPALESTDETFQPVVLTLETVDGSVPPGETCDSIVVSAVIHAYNKAHPEEDTPTMNSFVIHAAEDTPMEDGRRLDELDELDELEELKEDKEGEGGSSSTTPPLQGLFFNWYLHRGYYGDGGLCIFCGERRGLSSVVDDSVASSTSSFESELMSILKASDCHAFKTITGVSFEEVDHYNPHVVALARTRAE
eukprot:CAMPEP_0116545438 /NCGR_PEP_ID=MMETSP0397-20121206/2669_1 /TAXON_ID=216820 /ORGANISM="Cyclophora tenuis, Strain ECT3854" /LENGTH=548 /DNA_ID=CAMNT_0004069753 /DNA_START=975 /DNA_END=2621 /DNA_ORIENTATION=+